MPKTVQVTLGGKQYTIREKPMGQSVEWRTRLHNSRVYRIIDSLEQSISVIVDVAKQVVSRGDNEDMDWSQVLGATQILPIVANGLLHSIDDIWDLLFDYAPDIKADKAWIEENAYNDEGIAAFIELLKLNFPITALWALMSGSRVQQTPSSSPARNGASGLPVSGPKRKKSLTSS